MTVERLIPAALAWLFAPLLVGVIQRTKARFGGRTGQPLLQLYFDLFKLLRKGAVYSRTAGWVFRAGPIVSLAAIGGVLFLVPFGGFRAAIAFPADFVLLVYGLGAARFIMVLAALDTGSSFEGMGASRDVTFSALAEPALLLGLAALARRAQSGSLSDIYASLALGRWFGAEAAMLLVGAAFLIVLLAENARIPIDDPQTHLELTMIHEVMALDHGGPDLAFIQYGAALKLWLFGALLVGLLLPFRLANLWEDTGVALIGMLVLGAFVGVIESAMARLRLSRAPPLLIGAGACALLALLLVLP